MPKKDSEKKPGEENKELLETLQRVQAEFENSKKRFEREKLEAFEKGEARIVLAVIPMLESFAAAEKAFAEKKEVLEEVRVLHKKLCEILGQKGLEEIKTAGERFNPLLHEAMTTEEKEEEDIVLEELQKGFTFRGRLLKPAKVKVSRRKEEKAEKEFAEEEKKE